MDIITYPCPNLDAGLSYICWCKMSHLKLSICENEKPNNEIINNNRELF